MDTKQVLLGAADHIERYGLLKTAMVEDGNDDKFKTCAACAVGAIKVVASDTDRYLDVRWWEYDNTSGPAFRALLKVLAERFDWHLDGDVTFGSSAAATITYWNDTEERTADEVVSALRQAALLACA